MAKTKTVANDATNEMETPVVNNDVVNNDVQNDGGEQTDVLTEYNDKLAAQKTIITNHIRGGGELDDKEVLDANLEIVRLKQLIKSEEAKREQDKKAREAAELRNQRVKLADDLIEAVKSGNDDEIAKAREIVVNELLVKYC